jgi:hypothetical protein
MSDFTPEQKLAYYKERKAYWERKLTRLLAANKKKHAENRIAHYETKIAEKKS